MKRIPFPGQTPYAREVRVWAPAGRPLALVQLSHGMAEHIDRYDRLGQALAEAGYLVFGYNHLGHGAEAPQLGWFAQKDGWGQAVRDLNSVMEHMAKQHPGLPRVLLGHSMGSFLAREYALRYPDGLDALVLSGTGWYPRALSASGRLPARIIRALGRGSKPSRTLHHLSFSRHNKPFETKGGSANAWLSRDEAEVAKYDRDPLCGFMFTADGFYDLFTGLDALSRVERLAGLKKELPVYFLAGDHDPVGAFSKGVKTVYGQWKDAGLSNVKMKLYPEGRHEMFNEINREEVTRDLIDWLKQQHESPKEEEV